MIPNATDTVSVNSNISKDATGQFTVDENSLAKIMSVLTNLYSDPEGAVVREYLTNALDAQIEAQETVPGYVWRPIEVTTPSHWNKTYTVRDFGTGMNANDLKEIYSKYGKSTKEQSNSVTGMLGLGSKCALTYTGQFTITGYKGGVRTKAIVSKDENDIPVFMIVDTRASSEPNGVEISVPVRDRNSFAEKTKNFLRFWKDGQVTVDGQEPTKHGFTKVQDSPLEYVGYQPHPTLLGKMVPVDVKGTAEVFLVEGSNNGYRYDAPQSYVVMGNVPYAVDAEYVAQPLRDARMGFVAFVPMGAVDFPPSREKLMYNTRTKNTVSQISRGLFESILKKKLDEITNAATHKDAWTAYNALPYYFAQHPQAKGLTYKGIAFAERHKHDHMHLDWDWKGHGQVGDRQWVSIGNSINSTIIVTGVPYQTKPTSYFKKKVKFWIEDNNLTAHNALLVDQDIDSPWLAHLKRVDAQTIKDLKLPKDPNTNSGPRGEAPFEFYTINAKGQVERDEAVTVKCPAGKTLVYISPQDMKETYRKSGTTPHDMLNHLGDDYILVVTGKNRFEKFLRNHKGAISATKAVQERIDTLVAATTDAEYLLGKLEYGEKEFLKSVDLKDIKDPELVKLGQMVQSKAVSRNYEKAEALHQWSKRASVVSTLPERKKNVQNVVKRYPLISHIGGREKKHLVLYINAVYAETQP